MKAKIVDREALAGIAPAALRSYVQHEGWKREGRFGDHAEIFTLKTDEGGRELILPMSVRLADYASAVSRVLQCLSEVEGRDEFALYNDLSLADRDVIRVSAPDAEYDGSISVESGVDIISHARTALAAAACAAYEPRRAYHVGKVHAATDYMAKVRLGQTERGSFVVTLLAPVPPALSDGDQLDFWGPIDEDPFERRVTRMFEGALVAAQSAVEEANRGDGLRAFQRAIPKGVSANLCEAVAAITERGDGSELSVTWARTRPAPRRRSVVSFSPSDAEVLKEAAREFRLEEPRENELIVGFITKLDRDLGEVGGRATIKAFVDSRQRYISAYLSEDMYSEAIRAHEQRMPIFLTGELERRGQRWVLDDARNLELIELPDDVTDDAAE